MRRAGASSAVRRATKVAPLVLGLFRALVTAVYARGGGQLPQELSTGYRQAYRRLDAGRISTAFPPNDPQDTAWISPTRSPAPKLIQSWGFARDQGRWDDLAAIFHPGGEIAVSWFRGPYPEFVEHCRRNFGKRQRRQASALAGARCGERRPRHGRNQRRHPGAPDHRGRRGRSHLQRPLPRPHREARRRLAHGRARGAVREGPARSGRAVGRSSTR